MTSRLYVTLISGGGDLELTGFTGLKGSPFFEENTSLIELGHRFANGQASQGMFNLQDPLGEFPAGDGSFNLAAHKHITWTEDAPGAEIWLTRGRVSHFDVGRGKVPSDNFIEVDATVDDCNVDLGSYAFTEEWDRPEETGWERIEALQAFSLNGLASTREHVRGSTDIVFSATHLAPNSSTVTMPAKVYPVGTQPGEVILECADTEGKIFGVVIHHVGGSHLCLRYHAEDNHTVFPTPIKISDHLDEGDPEDLTAPVFEPHWEMGKATIWDSQELITGLVSIYGPDQASLFVENSGSVDDYEYWIDTYSDGDSENATQALAIADALLDYRAASNITHRVSVIMLPEQVALVTVGQSIQIKSAAAMAGHFLDVYQTRRIVELTWEPRTDGRYWAHMHIDRVPKRRPYSKGGPTKPPVPPTPGSTDVLCGPTDTIASGTGIFPTVNAFDCDDLTQFDSNAFPVNQQYMGADMGTPVTASAWRILQNTGASNAATTVTIYGTNDAAKWALAGAGGANYDFTAAGWTVVTNIVGLAASGENAGTFSSASFRYWVFRATAGGGNSWAGFSLELSLVGTAASTVGGTGEGASGPPGTYIPAGSVLEHNNITVGGPYHEAADVTFTPTGTVAATDVQAAIAEVAAEAVAGAPTGADYLVGTAQAGLSAEIVVGTTPGGELGGTWASPTVDATHSGSTHSAATDTHIADAGDAHDASAISFVPTGTIAATDVQAAIAEVASEGSVTAAAVAALGFVGPILMTDGITNPPEPMWNEAGDDYLYEDLG